MRTAARPKIAPEAPTARMLGVPNNLAPIAVEPNKDARVMKRSEAAIPDTR